MPVKWNDRFASVPGGRVVVNADDPEAAALGRRHGAVTAGTAAGADYRVVIQDGAKHGFTNPDADAHKGHGLDIGYDRQADRRSWADLQAFLKDIFGQG